MIIVVMPYILPPRKVHLIPLISEKVNWCGYISLLFTPLISFYHYLEMLFFSFNLENHYIVLHQGVLNKKESHLPYARIKSVFIENNVFSKILNVTTLIVENVSYEVNNAGTGSFLEKRMNLEPQKDYQFSYPFIGFSDNKVAFPGLSCEEAELLKTFLLKKMKEKFGDTSAYTLFAEFMDAHGVKYTSYTWG